MNFEVSVGSCGVSEKEKVCFNTVKRDVDFNYCMFVYEMYTRIYSTKLQKSKFHLITVFCTVNTNEALFSLRTSKKCSTFIACV